jgi:ribosomal protein L11 methyltransferase
MQLRLRRYLQDVQRLGLSVELAGMRTQSVADEDWGSIWRTGLGVIEAGRRLRIQPSWMPVEEDRAADTIVIDPQMAFGTGEHITTRFCLRALEEHVHQGDCVLDVGSGSGILSIAAVKLGARAALGLDTDVAALATASDNARQNGVSEQVSFSNLPLDRQEAERYHVVVANIDGQTLLPLVPELKRVTRPGGRIVMSGLRLADEEKLWQELALQKLMVDRREADEGWLSTIACRAGRG